MGIKINKKSQKNEINKLEYTGSLLDDVKKYICKIYVDKFIKGIGFFCYIPFDEKSYLMPSLITNSHLINEKNKKIKIKILSNSNNKEVIRSIDLTDKREKYRSVKYDTTIIEIKPNKDKIKYFLELDENINKQNSNEIYSEKSIYIIDYYNYHNSKTIGISLGTLKKISEKNKFDIYLLCSSKASFSGSPILFLSNNKVIGIQKEISNNIYDFNKGTFLKYPIKEFINKGKKMNKIILTVKIEEKDINKNIYFLNNIGTRPNNKILKIKDELYELNDKNIEIFINNEKFKYQKYFNPKKIGIYIIKLKLNIRLKNCTKLFYNCNNIISIDLSLFDSSEVTKTNYMFSRCNNLLYINFFNFDTTNTTDMSYMFSQCSNLENIELSSFNTEKVFNISYMFYNCCNISDINLSNFNTRNIIDMSFLFYNCKNLNNINLDNFNTKNVIDMSNMFSKCKKLTNINLSSFNTGNVSNMSQMFFYCYNLTNVDLSGFDTENVIDISGMFSHCYNLNDINLFNFDTKNVKYMNEMFLNCFSLNNIIFPSFNIKNIRNLSYMFYNCFNLSLINNEFFQNKSVKNDTNIFFDCISLYNS